MLRDILTSGAGVVTWPCDEINAIWRHGSRDHPTDEIPADRADMHMRCFVEQSFSRVSRRQHGHTVVEKTCANSLRVGYVAALLPRARFVLITRHGVDAAASALTQWCAPLDWTYTARKARFVPPSDLAHSAVGFARDRFSRRAVTSEGRRSWGPRFAGIDEMTASGTPEEVCATQWRRCVELSHAALSHLPADRVYRVSYEDFVTRPEPELVNLLRFLDLPLGHAREAVRSVSASSIGKGRSSLTADQFARVDRVTAPALERLGYV
jgi:hypothetical protein